ncbi:sirohydrochlorin chelatase [Aquabacterium humicola]|uniref:sirohydrochlorin chelatase n=1 Tax=Aquabacterium humicola TaxID=3237377 RepID=UPI002543101C|nr:CbiX/SirB N-terminal domain-containing protein [Rubrivivax pictus]
MNGLLLFAHGARDPAWARPFEAVARRCRDERPAASVELAFLEFMSPGLVEAGRRLAAAGCTEVDVLPLFLGAGGHVRKDVPVLLAQLEAEQPQVRWVLHPAIGEAAALVDAMATIALDAAALPVLPTR